MKIDTFVRKYVVPSKGRKYEIKYEIKYESVYVVHVIS